MQTPSLAIFLAMSSIPNALALRWAPKSLYMFAMDAAPDVLNELSEVANHQFSAASPPNLLQDEGIGDPSHSILHMPAYMPRFLIS